MNNINQCWINLFDKHKDLINSLIEHNEETPIYPPKDEIFKVFSMDVKDIKIVLLGQDPYHQKGQAHGLAFSVNKNIKIPPSLNNIYKELKNTYVERDYQFTHGNLERWFNEEKIFLLNCSLSVQEGKARIFMKKWQPFTDDVIQFIANNNKNCLFVLLGNFAKEKMKFIENKERCIVGVHPSPLSAHRGFLGSNIFKLVDQKLIDQKSGNIVDWSI